MAPLDQVEYLDLGAREGRVEVLVDGDDAGLVHRLRSGRVAATVQAGDP